MLFSFLCYPCYYLDIQTSQVPSSLDRKTIGGMRNIFAGNMSQDYKCFQNSFPPIFKR